MKSPIVALPLLLAVCCVPGRAQKTKPESAPHNSGPLAWIKSDVNPKTVFWIQGRFIPVGNPGYQGDADVVTILCSVREYECLEFDSTSPFSSSEQVWIDDYKPIAWDINGVMATTHSLDGCTDETLKIRFSPPSVLLINSPVLPISARCKKIDGFWDRLIARQPSGLAAETEQYELVPTRALFPWADANIDFGKVSKPVPPKKP